MFPPEIIALFVQEVAERGPGEALAPLLLVSKSFYEPARRHLFQTIRLFFGKDGDYDHGGPELQKGFLRQTRLLQLIQTSPDVLSHVRRLEVSSSPNLSRATWFWTSAQQDAFSQSVSLLKAFEDAPLQELVIDSIADTLILYLVPIRSLPTIRSLSLLCCGSIPPSLVLGKANAPGLRLLMIARSESWTKDSPPPPGDPFLPFSLLTTLIIRYPSDLARMTPEIPYSVSLGVPATRICLVEFPALKVFRVSGRASRPTGGFGREDYTQMWAAFARAPVLEEIAVESDLGEYPRELVLHMEQQVLPQGADPLRHLRKLTLKQTCRTATLCSTLRQAIIPILNDVLKFAHSSLASLTLDFSDCHEDSQRQYDITANGEVPSSWLELCDTLIQFTSLNEVLLTFSAVIIEQDSEEEGKIHKGKPQRLIEELGRRYEGLSSCLAAAIELNDG